MADSLRQQIVDALDALFKTILTTGGYETNIGSGVYWWRGEAVSVPELPALLCRETERITPMTGGAEEHDMTLTLEIHSTSPDDGDTMRRCIADVTTCLGDDRTLGGLVADIQRAGSSESSYVEHEGRKLFVSVLTFSIL